VRRGNIISLLLLILVTFIVSGCGKTTVKLENHFNKAVAFTKTGRVDEGIQELEKLIALDPEHARAYLALGVLYTCKGLSEKALLALNEGLKLYPEYEPVLGADVSSILRRCKFAPEQVNDTLYNMSDVVYIWRRIKYKQTCDYITRGCKNEREKILTLFDWVYRNIGIAIPKKDYTGLPLDIMQRGYGSCDRSASVLATLAEQSGYHANIFYLRDPNIDTSPHTVAIVFLEDKWVVFDTYSGVYFQTGNGKGLLGLNDIVNDPSITHDIARYKEYWSKCFEKGFVLIPVELEAALPKMQLAQQVLNELFSQPPKLYHNPVEELLFVIETSQGTAPSPAHIKLPFKIKNYLIDISFPPPILRFDMREAFNENVKRCNPELEYYRAARDTFLSGDYSGALKEYGRLLKHSPGRDYSDDLLYFRCLCFFELKDWEAASQELNRYLKEYPEGKWKAGAVYHLARSYEGLKLYEAAINEYKKIESIPNVNQRLRLLLSSKQ